jgi:acetoin utilization protein AcuB
MIVRTCMTPHPIALRADSDVRAALATMQEHAIRHLPVLDGDERVLGIVVERDLLLAQARSADGNIGIAEIMHRDVVCVRDDAPITHAATLMARNAIGGLPVIDKRDRVVGIVTDTDLLRAFVAVLEARTAREGVDLGAYDAAALAEAAATAAAGRQKHGRTKSPAKGKGASVKRTTARAKAAPAAKRKRV